MEDRQHWADWDLFEKGQTVHLPEGQTATVMSYQGRTRDDDDAYMLRVGGNPVGEEWQPWFYADKEGDGACWFQYQGGD
jgi:hypothetical protein